MALNVDNLSHAFKVGSVDGITFDTDTYINVIKRREEIVYRSSVPPESANVSYVASQEVNSSVNLSVADRSTSLQANRVSEVDPTNLSQVKTFQINTENFVVTDIFVTPQNTIESVPLFYRHILSTENLARVDATAIPDSNDFNVATGVKIVEVRILDQTLQPVKVSDSLFDLEKGIIYSNLLSEYNGTGDYVFYYVEYVVNDNGNIVTFVDLLNNQPVYRVAEFDDLTGTLQIQTDGRKVYLLDETTNNFTVTLPITNDYAFQPLSTSRIEVLPPVSSSVNDTWFVRVTNGTFFTNLNGILYKYYISEFLSQVFSPEPPLKLSQTEFSTVLTSNIIKLDRENITQDESLELFVDIIINDSDGNGLAAYTTNSSIVGNIASNGQAYTKWENVNRTGIKSIDHRTGFVDVEGIDLVSDYEIRSTYYFEEDSYEFTLVNFNPISNREVLTSRTVLFIDPDTSLVTKSQTLFYLKVDLTGRVYESNWPAFDNENEALLATGDPVYYEQYPTFLPAANHHVFIDEFTVEGSQTGAFLVLADMTVSPAFAANQVSKTDTRVRGGGVIESLYPDVRDQYPETEWLWDVGYWDGIPYPGNASYLVEVPVDVLQGSGGQFTMSEVRDIAERHTAAGVYPVTKAYGVEVTVSGLNPGEGTVEILWGSSGF